jgi:hypothetical protein
VDEWAWRKGQHYSTLLVDLEKQMPIDLLADATAESFAMWLQTHPSVEIVSRDRGTRLGLMEPAVERHKLFRLLIAGMYCTTWVRP